MSQQSVMDQNLMVYLHNASSANGSNGESILQVVTAQAMEELEMGLVSQAQEQPVAPLFCGWKIFVNAHQYHWHVQGAMDANDEAR